MSHPEQERGRSKGAPISTIIAILVILAGVGLLAYPHVIGAFYSLHRSSDTQSYDKAVDEQDQQRQEKDLAEAKSYNEWVASRHGASLTSLDPAEAKEGADADGSSASAGDGSAGDGSTTSAGDGSAASAGDGSAASAGDGSAASTGGGSPDRSDDAEISQAYEQLMNPSGNGVMGSITIDRLNLTVPLYHDDKEENMLYGAAHLRGTSLPIGGPSTHAAAWAHRGEPGASYFKDLDQVQIGDQFHVTAYGKTLTYEVDKISEVEPSDRTQLDVVEGKDLFTLITCTPYGVNTQRLLVRGHRVS